jgi:hypothetical protein
MLLLVFSLLIYVANAAPARITADFLVLAAPQKCRILNQYQQAVTGPDKEMFLPGTPLQILAKDETLSDQITRVMRVRLGGKPYFLMLGDDGQVAGAGDKSASASYPGCTVLDDTVEAVKPKAVRFGATYPATAAAEFLNHGEKVIRIFQYRDHAYILRQGLRPKYPCLTPYFKL